MNNNNEESEKKNYSLFFNAVIADHNLTETHLILHAILIGAAAILVTAYLKSSEHLLIYSIPAIGLIAVGLIASIISFFALERSEKFRQFWEDKTDVHLNDELQEYFKKNRTPDIKHSRQLLLLCVMTMYVFLGFCLIIFSNAYIPWEMLGISIGVLGLSLILFSLARS